MRECNNENSYNIRLSDFIKCALRDERIIKVFSLIQFSVCYFHFEKSEKKKIKQQIESQCKTQFHQLLNR